jgi:hypothetical protein
MQGAFLSGQWLHSFSKGKRMGFMVNLYFTMPMMRFACLLWIGLFLL